MLEKLIQKMLINNVNKNRIMSDEREIFEYGYRILLEKTIILLLMFGICILFHAWAETVIY